MRNRLLAILLSLCMLFSLTAYAAESEDTNVQPGTESTCGEGLVWTLEDGLLTIQGEGAMEDYALQEAEAPWRGVKDTITKVVIEEGVTYIGAYAFYDCDELTAVEIPDSVIGIGAYAFYGCKTLTPLELPESTTEIGENALNLNADAETEETLPEEPVVTEDDPTASAAPDDSQSTENTPEPSTTPEKTEPASAVSAEPNTIEKNPEVTESPEPETAETEAESTENTPEASPEDSEVEASGLEEVEVGSYEEQTKTLDAASAGWTYSISNGKASIAGYDGYATALTVPTSAWIDGSYYNITSIDAFAFEGNTTLRSITIPNGITSVGNGAFKNCTNLSSVTINGNLADCDGNSNSTWYDCANYSVFYNTGTNTSGMTVTFGTTVTRIPEYLFCTANNQSDNVYAHVTRVVLSSSITEIGRHAFDACYDLKTVDFSNATALKTIDSYAFAYTSIHTVSLPANLTSLNEGAFCNCNNLLSVTLPKKLNYIGNIVFKNCTYLNSITINGNLADCDGNSNSTWYDCANYSVFYNTGTNTSGMTVTFGTTVTRIPEYLFCTANDQSDNVYAHVTRVVLSSSITEIGRHAFDACYDLKTVDFSNATALKTIDSYAFAYTSIRTVSLPANLTSLNEGVFCSCNNLLSVVLPKSLTYVGDVAFKNCTYLNSVTINGNLDNCNSNSNSTWYDCANYSVFYNAGVYAGNGISVVFGSSVTRIPSYLFATAYDKSSNAYANVSSILIGSNVREIGDYAFGRCYGLETVNFTGSAPTISDNAFYDVSADAYYPDTYYYSWYSKRQDYGGDINWINAYLSNVLITSTIAHSSGNILYWNSVPNAELYQIFRRVPGGKYQYLRCTSGTGFKDTTAKAGVSYLYAVKAANGSHRSPGYSNQVTITRPISSLNNARITSTKAHSTGNILYWNRVENAQFYQVFRRTSGGKFQWLANTAGVGYKDTTAKAGVSYIYTVKAARSSLRSPSYSNQVTVTRPLANVTINRTSAGSGGNTLYWRAVTNAQFYQVFRRTSGNSFQWIANTTGTGYKDTTAKTGVSYIYAVKAAKGNVRSYGYSNTVTLKRPR